jgi:hypothetical protein
MTTKKAKPASGHATGWRFVIVWLAGPVATCDMQTFSPSQQGVDRSAHFRLKLSLKMSPQAGSTAALLGSDVAGLAKPLSRLLYDSQNFTQTAALAKSEFAGH